MGFTHFWGRGTFFISPPCGARFPDVTLDYYGPGDPDTRGFCLGGIGPHLGELGGFEIFATPCTRLKRLCKLCKLLTRKLSTT